MIPLVVPPHARSSRHLADSSTARGMIDAELQREARRHGPLPAGTRREALSLWAHLTIGSEAVMSPMMLLGLRSRRTPRLVLFARGAVQLAVEQAARGIRTIGGAVVLALGAIAIVACSTRDFEAGHRAPTTAFQGGIPPAAASAEGVDWHDRTFKSSTDAVILCGDSCSPPLLCWECCFYGCLCLRDPQPRRSCEHESVACARAKAARCP